MMSWPLPIVASLLRKKLGSAIMSENIYMQAIISNTHKGECKRGEAEQEVRYEPRLFSLTNSVSALRKCA
jgi:hypothetical protein